MRIGSLPIFLSLLLALSAAAACDNSVNEVVVEAEALRFSTLRGTEWSLCGLETNGKIACWGYAGTGTLGPGATDICLTEGMVLTCSMRPVEPTLPASAADLATGPDRTCALVGLDRTLYCWGGTDLHGQLHPEASGFHFARITRGQNHFCALTENGAAYCWGTAGSAGEIGTTNRNGSDILVPRAVDGGLNFISIDTHYFRTCGVATDARVYCWGQSLTDFVTDLMTPTPIPISEPVKEVHVGGIHECALTVSGKTYCWGWNSLGQMGYAPTSPTPTLLDNVPAFVELAVGGAHTCGRTADGKVYCWGYGEFGQTGSPTGTTARDPILVITNVAFKHIAAAKWSTCALDANGFAYCWGYNSMGALGDGTTNSSATPRKVLAPRRTG